MYAPHGLSQIAGRRAGGGPRRWAVRGLVLILVLTWPRTSPADGPEPPRRASTLVLVGRTVAQDQGAWTIDYRLRHTGPTGVVVAPEDVAVKVESWVSNSRVAAHAVPRRSVLAIPHGPELTAVGEVIAAADEAHRCREKLIVAVGSGERGVGRPGQTSPRPAPQPQSSTPHSPLPTPHR